MQRLRTARHLTRLVLVWFALALGVAAASPLVSPKSIELLCSGFGTMKLLVTQADGTPVPAAHAVLDCPLCAPVAAPPPAATVAVPAASPLGQAIPSIPRTCIAALSAAPPPGRGPPSSLSIQ